MLVTSLSQLSVATGFNNCAAVKPAVLLHSKVAFKEPIVVVQVGATISLTITVRVIGTPIQAQQLGLTEVNVNVTKPL